MGFYETPARRYLIVRGCGFLVLCAATLGLLLAPLGGAVNWKIAYGFAVVFALAALLSFLQAKRTPKTDIIVAEAAAALPPGRLPAPIHRHLHKQMLWKLAIVCAAVSGFLAYDLRHMGPGEGVHHDRDGLFTTINAKWGYWPTVLSPIAFGIVMATAILHRLRKIGQFEATQGAVCADSTAVDQR